MDITTYSEMAIIIDPSCNWPRELMKKIAIFNEFQLLQKVIENIGSFNDQVGPNCAVAARGLAAV